MPAAHVIEVTDATFATEVLERSRSVPVLVDFWAPWCGPCRMLGPVLEKLAAELDGSFVLAKVNTDENQGVAGRYRVSGIPDVKLFSGGEVVGGFVGAQPERNVRAFLDEHLPGEADAPLTDAAAALERGDDAAARAAFEQALALDATSPAAHLGLARLDLAGGDFAAARAHAAAVPASAREHDAASKLVDALALAEAAAAAGPRDALEARFAADASDLEARFALAGYEVGAGHYADALEGYYQVVQADRKWHDEAARKAMVTVFGVIGARHPLSDSYRDKLQVIY